MKLRKSIVIIVITFALSSCSLATPKAEQSSPNIGVEVQVGKYLEMTAPNGWNSFRTNDAIALEVRNISESQIMFDKNLGARIFVLTDKGWVEVKDKLINLNENITITLDPSKIHDPLKTETLIVRPDFPDYSVPYDVRVFIVGTLIEDGKESNQIASYIDLSLRP